MAVMLLVGCKKETTYTLKWNVEGFEQFKTDVLICENSKDNEIVNENSITDIKYSDSYSYTAHENAEKCKLYLTWNHQGSTVGVWIDSVYFLEKGKHIDIIVDNNTIRTK